MDAVATAVEDVVLNAHTVIGLYTPLIDAVSYMADLPVLFIWLGLLIIQQARALSHGAHPHLKVSSLRPTNMRSAFVSLKHPTLPLLLLLPSITSCLTHSYAPWMLDTRAFDHISGNKDLFSSLTFLSPLPTITLANGSQTIAKGIGSACLLPSLPLTFVLYVPDFPFNLIFISKLTRDLHCVLTFSHNSVTLQDRNTRKTIGIGHES